LRAPSFSGTGFHVVLRGACWLVPEDGEPIRMGAGDVVLVPHGTRHELIDTPAADRRDDQAASTMLLCGGYLMDGARQHPLFGELPEAIHVPARVDRHASLRAVIDILGAELLESRPGVDGVMPALLETVLLYILRAWYDDQADHHHATGWAAALRDPVVAAALRAMHQDPAHAWTVRALGARAGLSRAPFARRFTALIGQPPLTYLTWWRMTVAARLLRHSDASVRRVAEQVGYTSEFAFAKAFKREHGTTPGRYRRDGSSGADRVRIS
jgi:AraC-like DNA-binding protein